MKTPGVIIVEKNPFPKSVEEVPTAVPAFIGYTARASDGKASLINQPFKITSLSDYVKYFGEGPLTSFNLAVVKGGEPSEVFAQDDASYGLSLVSINYLMWNSIRLFYQNGGSDCYVVSVGGYDDDLDASVLAGTGKNAGKGLSTLANEPAPTIVVIPDLMSLTGKSGEGDCISVQKEMLVHCGDVMKNRVAILDVYNGYKDRKDTGVDVLDKFRKDLGNKFLDYGCAYYPWLETTVVQATEVGILNLDGAGRALLQEVLTKELFPAGSSDDDPRSEILRDFVEQIISVDLSADERSQLQTALMSMSPIFKKVLIQIRALLNVMPPSATMAGVFTAVDNNKGVWKAPANVALNTVKKLTVDISEDELEDLNVSPAGKSINAIRKVAGQGIMVWGGRTLDGNSQEWQYINVRRTTIMIEETAKNAVKAYENGPNDASSWTSVKGMLDDYLTELWRFGTFAGGRPEEAFEVSVGLGSTMTEKDIKGGIMKVSISMALQRNTEDTVVTFEQKIKKS